MVGKIFRFFRFYFSADTLHGVHSPFVFSFCQRILDDQRQYYAFEYLERLRKILLTDQSPIPIDDFGAGSQLDNRSTRPVSQLVRYSATHQHFSRILFKIVLHYQPKTILELGTSLGMSTLYLASASPARIFTLEGCAALARRAREHFKQFGKNAQIQLIEGTFEQQLEPTLKKLDTIDLIFFDGNHKKAPTLFYFEKCLEKATADSIFIFDDIYWSKEMMDAWKEIKAHPRVTLSIDLYQFGIVFFKEEFKQVQHWKLLPLRWKPWQVW